MKAVEIERKFLVKIEDIPSDYKKYKCSKLIQGFIYLKPVIRIRKADSDYILTIKEKMIQKDKKFKDMVRKEYEFPISIKAFKYLSRFIQGRFIYKKRYFIPYRQGKKKYTIELDVFEKDYKGLIYAEVEFESVREALNFKAPSWFYKEVTNISKYNNTSLSICKSPKSILKY